MLLSNTKYSDYNLDTGLKLDIGFLFLVLIINIFSSLSLAMYIYVCKCFVFLCMQVFSCLLNIHCLSQIEFPTKRGNKRKMKKHFIKDIHLIIVGKCSFISIHQ